MAASETMQDSYEHDEDITSSSIAVDDAIGNGNDDVADNSLAIGYALQQVGAQFSPEQLRNGQKKGISAFSNKRDAMVILPTGHGKSVIYWTAPFLNDFDLHFRECGCSSLQHIQRRSIGIIVSPLIALMKDQVAALRREGVEAFYMGETSPDEEKKLKDGNFSLVFCSPEGILSDRGTSLLSSSVYRNNVCGVFVDEGHCIAKWGYKSGKVQAFRKKYSRLAELRSFVKSCTPLMVLTATASPTVKALMVESLGLSDHVTVEESPERKNIRYSVVDTTMNENKKDDMFKWLSHLLKSKTDTADKILIFCKTHRNAREIHAFLERDLPEDQECIVALFSGVSADSRKREVLTDFTKRNSKIRVLLATSAFGMGINVKGLHHVIGFGASRDIDDYFQESGRVGRDGSQSHAILINYKGNFGKGKTDESMRKYVSSNEECRRKCLMAHYCHAADPPAMQHDCCDICAKQCSCGECVNGGMSDIEHRLRHSLSVLSTEDIAKCPCREPNDEVRVIIKDLLGELQESLLTQKENTLYTGKDIATGFPSSLIDVIADNYEFIGSIDQLKLYPFFDENHINKVWNILEEIGGEVSVVGETGPFVPPDESDFTTLSDFEEDDLEGRVGFIYSQCSHVILPDEPEEDD